MRPSRLVFCIALIAIALFVFWPARDFEFVDWDDNIHIYNNPYLRSEPPDVAAFWRAPHIGLYIPVTFTAWSVIAMGSKSVPDSDSNGSLPTAPSSDYSSPLDPRPFHAANIFFHAFNALLVFLILHSLFANQWSAAAGAALFALHPLQVEAVAWATGFKDVLGAFFSFLALWLYLLHARARDEDQAPHKQYFFITATLVYILALLSKPSAVALPLIAWCLDFCLIKNRAAQNAVQGDYPFRRAMLQSARPLLLWLIPAALLTGAMRFSIQKVEQAEILVPLWSRVFIAGDALAFYLAKIIYPASLVIVYGRRPDLVLNHWWGYATWLAPALLIFFSWRWRHRFPFLLAATGVFIAALLPTSGLVPFAFQHYSTVADRYVYPAMLGGAVLLCGVLTNHSRRAPRSRFAPVALVLTSLWLIALGWGTRLQLQNWREDEALWEHLLSVDSQSWVAHNNLGGIYLEQGQTKRALEYLRRAEAMRPDDVRVLVNLGDAHAALKQPQRALEYYAAAIRTEPKELKSHINRASLLLRLGKIKEAEAGYRAALEIAPSSASANYNLGLLLARRGEHQNAASHYEQALKTRPDDAAIHDALATALARTSRVEDAQQHWQEAIRLDPKFIAARTNLGVLLAMQGSLDAAIAQWQAALKVEPQTKTQSAQLHFYLGQTHMMQNRNAQAVVHLQQALRFDPSLAPARTLLKKLQSQQN